MTRPTRDITQLLEQVRAGDREALDGLLPLVYGELRRQAARYLRRERPGHTLQPTALVHEAYVRLVGQRDVHWQNRAHFLGVAAQAMRRILIDHARGRQRVKRGGPQEQVSLDDVELAVIEPSVDLLALDEALDRLATLDAQQARIVELRFFGGLTVEETAEVLGISPASVKLDWSMAKAWLRTMMTGRAGDG